MTSVRVTGLLDLKKFQKDLAKAKIRAARITAEAAVRLAPIRTGHLVNSIRVTVGSDTPDETVPADGQKLPRPNPIDVSRAAESARLGETIFVAGNAPHTSYVEYGTERMEAQQVFARAQRAGERVFKEDD